MRIAMVYVALVLMICMFIRQGDAFQPPGIGTATGPYRLSLELDGGKRSFGLGEPIVLSAKIWNAAGFPLDCPKFMDYMGFYKVDLSAPSSNGVTASPHWISVPIDFRHWSGRADARPLMPSCSILPGEFYRAGSIRVSDVFKVTQKGRYRVNYSRVFPNPMNKSELLRVSSEELLFTVE